MIRVPNAGIDAAIQDINDTERALKSYIRDNPHHFRISNIKSTIYLFILFVTLSLGIYIGIGFGGLGYVFGFFIVGITQYHLSVAIHEASHFTLFSPRNVNEAVGYTICAFLGFDLVRFRKHHILHHIHYATDEDPDWPEYQLDEPMASRAGLLLKLIRERCIWGATVRLLKRIFQEQANIKSADTSPRTRWLISADSRFVSLSYTIIAQFALIAIFSQIGNMFFYIYLWVLPLATVPMIISGIRMFGEHGGLCRDPNQGAPRVLFARTCASRIQTNCSAMGMLEWLTLGAFNFDFHHEHHWFPNTPYHALPRIHEHLVQGRHFERYPQCRSRSFTDVLDNFVVRN